MKVKVKVEAKVKEKVDKVMKTWIERDHNKKKVTERQNRDKFHKK